MSSDKVKENEEEAVSVEAEALLAEKLQELRDVTTSTMDVLHALFALVTGEHGDEEAIKELLVSTKGVETIIEATKYPATDSLFLSRAMSVFLELIAKSEERTTYFIDNGGLAHILDMMETHKSDSYHVFTSSGFLYHMFQNLSDEQRASISLRVFETILPIMELHKDDGITFSNVAEALSCSVCPNMELSPELTRRAKECATGAIIRHQYYSDAQMSGQSLLKAVAGPDAAQEILSTIVLEDQFVSEEATAALFGCIMELRFPSSADTAVKAIETMFRLSMDETDQKDALQTTMISMNAVETILKATRDTAVASSYFLHRAGGILFFLLHDSQERSALFLSSGGFDRSLEIIESNMATSYLVVTYLGVISIMLTSLSDEDCVLVSDRAFMWAVEAMLVHKEDAYLFYHACATVGLCLGPHMNEKKSFLHAAAQCVYNGILKHKDSEDAQESGRALLVALVGPENAMKMIDHAEMHHNEQCTCSGAA